MALTENQGDERIHVPPSAGMPVLHKVIFLVLLAFLMVLPFMVYPVFAMKVMCFALFAAAFNLLLGFGGLLSFGHAAFFGTASYVAAHAAKVWGLTPELAVLAGTGAAALLGLAIGALAVRRQGIYFAMVTLAFAQMVYFFALQTEFTGGEDGKVLALSADGSTSELGNAGSKWITAVAAGPQGAVAWAAGRSASTFPPR